jgi:type IV secretory pathway VirB10-like protein
MNVLPALAMSGLMLLVGCSKAREGAATPPTAEVPATAPAATAPPVTEPPAATAPHATAPPPSEPPAHEPGAEVPAKQPLSHYLSAAVTAKVYAIKLASGGGQKTLTKDLDAAATKAYLGSLDLSQHADGPVAKCPSDTLVELADGKGEIVGTIGFCQGKAPTFGGPDGTSGGIRAAMP